MDHTQFKANQTAAVYVADGLDEGTQEAFEMHLMGCAECVDDVEVWRALKLDMPRVSSPQTHAQPVVPRPGAVYGLKTRAEREISPKGLGRGAPAFTGWRLAASVLVAIAVGAAGGWFGKATQSTDLNSTETVVFNVPAVMRGAEECTPLSLASDTRTAVLRVPGVSQDLRVVALDSEKRELSASRYASRIQPDGSQLVRIDSELLTGRSVHLEARRSDGSSEPLGCVTGEISAR